jgi:hypothetical protein
MLIGMDNDGKNAAGQLLERLRREHRPQLSMRAAAAKADLSDGRWRQIENGYQSLAQGRIEVTAPPATLARMVRAIGGSAEDLRAIGNKEAADLLDQLVAAEVAAREARQRSVEAALAAHQATMVAEMRNSSDEPKFEPSLDERIELVEHHVMFLQSELAAERARLEELLRQRDQGSYPRHARLSVADDNIPDAVAAHDEEDVPTVGEQGESDLP